MVYNSTGLIGKYAITISDPKNIYVNGDGSIQITNWYEVYTYSIQNDKLLLIAQDPLETSEVSENSYTRLLSKDDRYSYELQTQLVSSGMLLGEISVVAIDSIDNIVASASIC